MLRAGSHVEFVKSVVKPIQKSYKERGKLLQLHQRKLEAEAAAEAASADEEALGQQGATMHAAEATVSATGVGVGDKSIGSVQGIAEMESSTVSTAAVWEAVEGGDDLGTRTAEHKDHQSTK